MNKKLLALLLAILMVAMSAVAMAETGIYTSATDFFDISKEYNLGDSTAAMSTGYPKETLSFTATYAGVTNNETGAGADTAPSVTIDSIDTSKALNAQGAITVSLPANAKTGLYEYTVSETAGSEAGVTYSSESFKLYVLVAPVVTEVGGVKTSAPAITTIYVNDGDSTKLAEFKFTNKLNKLGSVEIKKAITGNIADKAQTFEATITMTSSKPVTSDVITITGAGTVNAVGAFTKSGDSYVSTTTVTVTDGTTITLGNVPEGVVVTVAETESGLTVNGITYASTVVYGGDTSKQNVSVATGATSTIAITNTANGEVPTGVRTDTMPYILLMAFVAILAVAFVAKKRSVNE